MSDFGKMLKALKSLGNVSYDTPTNKNGKPSKFKGSLRSLVKNNPVELGLLHYPWKRAIGVNKINQAIQYTENAGLDGALLIGTTFSKAAVEQAFRINQCTDKRILLIESEEIDGNKNNEDSFA
jgi:hypothetical protein